VLDEPSLSLDPPMGHGVGLVTGVVRVGLGGRGWSPGLDVGVFHVGLGRGVAGCLSGGRGCGWSAGSDE